MITAPSVSARFHLVGCLIPEVSGTTEDPAAAQFRMDSTAVLSIVPPSGSPAAAAAARFGDILPWFIHNALIHYLARGALNNTPGEGGVHATSVRDQWSCSWHWAASSPYGTFLSGYLERRTRRRLAAVVHVLRSGAKHPVGRFHGDIVFWPVLALADYLIASEDATLLKEKVPFFHPDGDQQAENATLWQHVEQALAAINARVIPAPGWRLTAMATGTIPCNQCNRRCANICAAPGR